MNNNILKNWTVLRIVRLVAGAGLAIYAGISGNYLFFILAGLFLIQAILNRSCCGCSSGSCSVNSDNGKK